MMQTIYGYFVATITIFVTMNCCIPRAYSFTAFTTPTNTAMPAYTTNHASDKVLHESPRRTFSFLRNARLTSFSGESSPDELMRMVEELSDEQFSTEEMFIMQEVEQVLTSFIEEKNEEQQRPQPPGVPPPIHMLKSFHGASEDTSLSLLIAEAEATVEKLRERLRREEQSVNFSASLSEKQILENADEALRQSKEAAAKRANQNTEIFTNSDATSSEINARFSKPDDAFTQETPTESNVCSQGMNESVRSTIPLDLLTQKKYIDRLSGDDIRIGIKGESQIQASYKQTPSLYNWIQHKDGSIDGLIKNSSKFVDGTTISTSPVDQDAVGGTIVETQSGSRYFLEKTSAVNTAEIKEDTLTNPDKPYETIPSIIGWRQLESGSVAGFLYEHLTASDGDFVQTSPIINGTVEDGHIVTTESGSKYFLKGAKSNVYAKKVDAFKGMLDAKIGSTIALTTGLNKEKFEKIRGSLAGIAASKPNNTRQTFSLSALTGNKKYPKMQRKEKNKEVPMLSEWKLNCDGTVTGVINGSSYMNDGDVVTTSALVTDSPQRFQNVETESGSVYYLA